MSINASRRNLITCATCASLVAMAWGQPICFPSCNCDDSCPPDLLTYSFPPPYPLPVGMTPLTWLQGTWWSGMHHFDRRPAVTLNFPESDASRWSLAGNPEGLKKWWRQCGQNVDGSPKTDEATYTIDYENHVNPDQFLILVEQLENLYTNFGFRRFIFNMPAGSYFGKEFFDNTALGTLYHGSVFGGEDVPFNQWSTMPLWKRQQFQAYGGVFKTWCRAHSDATFELYMGSAMVFDGNSLQSHLYSKMYPGSRNGIDPDAVAVAGPDAEPRNVTIRYEHNPDNTISEIKANRWLVNNNIVVPEAAIDPRDRSHLSRLVTNVKPWMDCGFKMFWLDAGVSSDCSSSSPPAEHDYNRRRFGLDEITYCPWFVSAHTRFGGENIPAGPNHVALEHCSLTRTAYMELDSEIYHTVREFDSQGYQDIPEYRFTLGIDPNTGRPIPDYPTWTPGSSNPETECHYLVANLIQVPPNRFGFDVTSKLEQIGRARLGGYVCSPYYTYWDGVHRYEQGQYEAMRLVQRWYNMGIVRVADFNGDGVVNSLDSDELTRAYATWNDLTGTHLSNRPFVVFAMGDVNHDGFVNDADLTAFQEAVAATNGGVETGPTITYGAPIGL